MAYNIAIYDWSLYTLPASIPMTDIEGDTHSNDPASPDYAPAAPSWIGQTYTYNSGASTLLQINDDDSTFEDGYVETGGAQTLAQDVTINGTTYLAGSVVENEFSMLDATGNEVWVVRIDGVNVGFSYPSGNDPTPGETFTPTVGRDGDPADSGDGVGSSEPYKDIICFTAGALIETPSGAKPVEQLDVGDLVNTLDNGPQAIRWMSRRSIIFTDDVENAKPIQIKAGAFSPGLPHQDLVVSPQHRFMLHETQDSTRAEVFVAAKALTALPRVRIMNGKKCVEYFHLALRNHEVIIVNGVPTESCYLGPVVLDAIPKNQRATFRSVFPSIRFNPGRGYGPIARPHVKVQRAKELLRSRQLGFAVSAT